MSEVARQCGDCSLCCKGETVHSASVWAAQPGKSVQWTDLSVERRELGRAAGNWSRE